ncbi:hypothetical protein [Streptomyces sp. NPDC007988]|uniref:hypothetical protein n=1 Tax=Streptomyces sp. NPDC007988 TaxID=3364802 RepID=UPI0036F10B9F
MKTPRRTYPDVIVVGAVAAAPGRAPGPGPSVPGAVVLGPNRSVFGGDVIVVGAVAAAPGRTPGPGPSVPGAVVLGPNRSVSGGDVIVVGAVADVPGRAPGPGPSVPGAVALGRGLSVCGGDAPGRGGSPRGARSEVHGTGTGDRELVAARALPAMGPPSHLNRSTGTPRRLPVRGGHRPTGTVRGATASGTRAARVGLAGRAR